jgi:hypothetical protein
MSDPSADALWLAHDGPIDPRRRRAVRLGGPARLTAAEAVAAARTRDRLARDLVAAIAAARRHGTAARLVRCRRALGHLRRQAGQH